MMIKAVHIQTRRYAQWHNGRKYHWWLTGKNPHLSSSWLAKVERYDGAYNWINDIPF